MLRIFTAMLLFISASLLLGESLPVDSPRWDVKAKTFKIEQFAGQKGILIERGSMLLKDTEFSNGTIEYDFLTDGTRGFSGVQFRLNVSGSNKNGEEFYIRHHLSGKPDATQYTPLVNSLSAWQLYHGPQYSTALPFKLNEWTHVKIVVEGQLADFYFNRAKLPTLTVRLKSKEKKGAVAVYSNFAPGRFANISITPDSGEKVVGKPVDYQPTPDSRVMKWEVSNAFDQTQLADSLILPTELMAQLKWHSLEAEEKGIANLSKVNQVGGGTNTAFARFTIDSENEQLKPINIGYSDKVRVYVNGQMIYAGTNRYVTRDYRYLGTIGLFDTVIAPLKPGKNDIVFAVTEAFGGWGIMADYNHD